VSGEIKSNVCQERSRALCVKRDQERCVSGEIKSVVCEKRLREALKDKGLWNEEREKRDTDHTQTQTRVAWKISLKHTTGALCKIQEPKGSHTQFGLSPHQILALRAKYRRFARARFAQDTAGLLV
jgi:hypothetical protein